jgi:hypothetical protein
VIEIQNGQAIAKHASNAVAFAIENGRNGFFEGAPSVRGVYRRKRKRLTRYSRELGLFAVSVFQRPKDRAPAFL